MPKYKNVSRVIHPTVLSAKHHTREHHEAFTAALEELFKRYPLPYAPTTPEYAARELRRDTVLKYARTGFYWEADRLPLGDFAAPTDEVKAIHALIYG